MAMQKVLELTYNDPKLGIQVVNLEPSNVCNTKSIQTGRFRTSPWIQTGHILFILKPIEVV